MPLERQAPRPVARRIADQVEQQFSGASHRTASGARRVEIWTNATSEVEAADVWRSWPSDTVSTPIRMMLTSGARGNTLHIRQNRRMRGCDQPPSDVSRSPSSPTSVRPGAREYFIATRRARKGRVATALRTPTPATDPPPRHVGPGADRPEDDCAQPRIWQSSTSVPTPRDGRTYVETGSTAASGSSPLTLSDGTTAGRHSCWAPTPGRHP